ncbi:24232_t:CDS:2 [Gigaspora margarita]|uniref:24232_t:CDS:1 n=1 Tax=Gigaspora margarita TaxID=4874 RepID=A0ABN7VFX4_GIGMA|nr:24232_t:CDS:2 [Gigaspora margarita]
MIAPPPRLITPPSGLIIVTFPSSSILSHQHCPIQDLAKEHQILIVGEEIEETDMVNDPDYDPDEEHYLDNYMWYGDGASSDQERYNNGEIE